MGDYQPFFPDGWRPAARNADCCHPVAVPTATDDGLSDWGEGAQFRRFQRHRVHGGASVATVAAVAAPKVPWADGLALLQRLPCPEWVTPERWERLVYHATMLSQDWGEQANALGWTTTDLFGCNPFPWVRRIDRNGLAITLADWCGPIRVRAMAADRIALEVDRGHRLHFYRFAPLGSVPIWVAYAQEGGP